MKINKLRLKDYIGIRRGLGLGEIEVDFTGHEGLIAIEGENGRGKTVLLESLSPYNRLASREGALFKHVDSRNAERELSFSYGGHNYRTLIKIDCQSEKQEGFLWKDGKSEINGKITEYNKYIKNLLGSPDLFYSSVFCSQNSAKLSEMTTSELKGLFSEFLRLDRLVDYENTAKQCANVLSAKMGQVDIRIMGLKERLQGSDALQAAIVLERTTLESHEADLDCKKGELSSYRTEVESLKAIVASNAAAIQKKADIQAVIDTIEKEIVDINVQAEKELADLRRQYTETEKEGRKYAAVLEKKEGAEGAAERDTTINQELIELLAQESELVKQFEAIREDVEQREKTLAELRLAKSEFDSDKELARLEKEITYLKNECRHGEDKIKDLDKRDPECQSKTCSFIIGALQAKDGLADTKNQLQKFVNEHADRHTFIKGELEKCAKLTDSQTALLSEKKKEVVDAKAKINVIRDKKATRQAILKELASLITLLPEIQIAQARQEDAKKSMEELVEKGIATKAAWDKKTREKEKQMGEQDARHKEVNALIDTAAEGKLKGIDGDIQSIEKVELPQLEKKILGIREKIAALQSDLSKMADATAELEKEQEEKGKLTREISEWTYLRSACSKNGLQALEIDGTAPLITSFANDLLSKSFGTLYSVRLLTQDEEGKEVLNIMVVGEDGEEDLLENKSGGEKVFCLMALRLAMTLLSKEKGGHAFLTAFSDESDGALDPENALNYVAMYRSFMQVGAFENFLFISHRPECRNMADHVLTFENGKNPEWR